MSDRNPGDLVAIDADTGRLLSEAEATAASDNPMIYKWVRWVSPLDVSTEETLSPVEAVH
jgi:hypothetical protein